jgi:hypothetical protein
MRLDARNHYPRIKHHTPPPSRATTRNHRSLDGGPRHTPNRAAGRPWACCLRTQQCVWQHPENPPKKGSLFRVKSCSLSHPADRHYSDRLHTAHTLPMRMFLVVLLRKEVIQPHLPVRLPCYDFVPIADPTFDSSLHKG